MVDAATSPGWIETSADARPFKEISSVACCNVAAAEGEVVAGVFGIEMLGRGAAMVAGGASGEIGGGGGAAEDEAPSLATSTAMIRASWSSRRALMVVISARTRSILASIAAIATGSMLGPVMVDDDAPALDLRYQTDMERLEHEEELDWNAWPGRKPGQIAEEQAA
jgi:hypothetical protein